MNEFVAKKLGEVLAFATVALESAELGKEALKSAWGAQALEQYVELNEKHIILIKQLAENIKVENIVEKKLASTGDKLRKMRDLYVGDEWGNSTELMEWSGFFEGAAVGHWELIGGVAEGAENKTLSALAKEAIGLHQGVYTQANHYLRENGKTKAQVEPVK